MIKDRVIELENGTSYYIIEELEYEGKKYVLGAECNLEKDEINDDEYILQEVYFMDDNETIATRNIDDEKEAKTISALIFAKMNNIEA